MEVLRCDRCKVEYTNEESIAMAKRFQEKWKKSCENIGREPRGIAPCPVVSCPGELHLKEV